MIRKLRTKLVAAAMLSLLAVLTVILGVILLTNYRGIVSDADRILDLLADNQGKFPEIKADFDWEELGPRHRSVELGYETRYFSVLLDRQGTVLATDTGKIAAVDEETAASYAQAVWAQDSPRGFWQDYRYLEAREGENTRVIFLDYGAHLFTFHSTLVTSLWVAASGLLEEQGRQQFLPLPFSELVAEAAQAFQAVAKRQNKTLSVDVQPMLTLVGEEKSLVQLVSILLDNALKYSPEGGQIALRLSRQGKHLRLSVENTAEVLSKELLENMFDRFYRGDASRNSGQGGYGIGLSIAKAVVQAHRGKLSAAAKGTDRLVITALFPSA